MALWLSLWIPILTTLSAWVLTQSFDWKISAFEQLRLDAVALSLCHTRKNFILEKIDPLNETLALLQNEMDSIAAACSGPTTAECEIFTRTILQATSIVAKGIEAQQDLAVLSLDVLLDQKWRGLLEQNKLPRYQNSRKSHLGRKAWQRESLSPHRLFLESRWEVLWPRTLRPSPFFQSVQSEFLTLKPERRVLTETLKTEVRSFKEGSRRLSESICALSSPPHLSVERR